VFALFAVRIVIAVVAEIMALRVFGELGKRLPGRNMVGIARRYWTGAKSGIPPIRE
jgi:hypothetical protein